MMRDYSTQSKRKGAVTRLLRTLKQRLVPIRLTKLPILIFGLRRGGSTLLADMIACNPGIWFANEPYAVTQNRQGYKVKKRFLPEREHSAYFNLSSGELSQFQSYTTRLLEGKFRTLGTCRHTRFGYADRTVLKILNAPWMLSWFLENIKSSTLVILRHPGAQMASTIRQGWGFQLCAFAKDEGFLYQHWTDQQVSKIMDISKSDDVIGLAMLDWIVNSEPLRTVMHRNITKIRYEDLITDPQTFINDVLKVDYGLEYTDRMNAIVMKPSGSMEMSTTETNSLILKGQPSKLLNKWQEFLSVDDRRRCQNILELFEITEYSML